MDLEHGKLPDPISQAIRLVMKDSHNIEDRLKKLEQACGLSVPADELEASKEEIEKELAEGDGI